MAANRSAVWVAAITIILTCGVFPGSEAAAKGKAQEQSEEAEIVDPSELPAPVKSAIRRTVRGARVADAAREVRSGIVVYDVAIEGDGEMLVAEDGTVLEVSTVVRPEQVPRPVSDAFALSAAGADVDEVDRVEVRAEIRGAGPRGTIVRLAAPSYLYEASLSTSDATGEMRVDPRGRVVAAPTWVRDDTGEDGLEEAEDATEPPAKAGPDLTVLPPAVLGAFRKAYPDALVRDVSKETRQGAAFYRVRSIDAGMDRDLLYAADGKAVEVREMVPPAALPAAVKSALFKTFPGVKILKAERLARAGLVTYALRLEAGGRTRDVAMDPDGTIVK